MTASWLRNRVWAVAVLLLGVGFAYFLLVGKPQPEPKPPPQIQAPSVDVVVVEPGRQAISVETQGTVRPLREIDLVSQVAGRVEAVSPRFEAGEFFVAGEELLKLEDIDYQFAISRAESQVAAARQRVAEEKGRALQASREWRDLGSKEANALFLRKPQLASAEAALKAAQSDLEAARLNLERTSMRAPFNGRISQKHVDLGQYITPGAPIARIYDTDIAQVRLPLTDRQVALLDLPLHYADDSGSDDAGVAVVFSTRFANKSWEWEGRIVRTDANIDVNSRVVYAVAEIAQPFARVEDSERPPLAPGLFVSATINGRELADVAVLPRSALRSDGAVMLVDSGDIAQSRAVDVLHSDSDQVWIQGLDAGDRVIVDEGAIVVVGMEVTVNNVTQIAGSPN